MEIVNNIEEKISSYNNVISVETKPINDNELEQLKEYIDKMSGIGIIEIVSIEEDVEKYKRILLVYISELKLIKEKSALIKLSNVIETITVIKKEKKDFTTIILILIGIISICVFLENTYRYSTNNENDIILNETVTEEIEQVIEEEKATLDYASYLFLAEKSLGTYYNELEDRDIEVLYKGIYYLELKEDNTFYLEYTFQAYTIGKLYDEQKCVTDGVLRYDEETNAWYMDFDVDFFGMDIIESLKIERGVKKGTVIYRYQWKVMLNVNLKIVPCTMVHRNNK